PAGRRHTSSPPATRTPRTVAPSALRTTATTPSVATSDSSGAVWYATPPPAIRSSTPRPPGSTVAPSPPPPDGSRRWSQPSPPEVPGSYPSLCHTSRSVAGSRALIANRQRPPRYSAVLSRTRLSATVIRVLSVDR